MKQRLKTVLISALVVIMNALVPQKLGAQGSGQVLGYLEPIRSIELEFLDAGRIQTIHVEEGAMVNAGDPLVSLDNRVLEAQLSIAKVQAESDASIEMANAELSVSSERYTKLSRLRSSGTAHTSEVARAKADLTAAKARLQIAEEEKRVAELRQEEIQAQIDRRILTSPISGVVLEINRDVAESASNPRQGDQESLVRIAQIDQLELTVHVPARKLGLVELGRVLPISISAPDDISEPIAAEGTVTFVSPVIDPSSETVRIKLLLDNSEGNLKSGSHAKISFDSFAAR